jgi:hypothetical protein
LRGTKNCMMSTTPLVLTLYILQSNRHSSQSDRPNREISFSRTDSPRFAMKAMPLCGSEVVCVFM